MNATPIFREVREDEVDVIADIAVRAFERIYEGYRHDLGDELFRHLHAGWQTDKAEQVRNAARTRPGMVWVTEMAGVIVGFTTFKIDEDRRIAEIGNNAVLPERQGQGIGTFQHRKVLEVLRARGMTHVMVQTGLDEGHAAARASYERIGFKPIKSGVTYCLEL